MDGNPPSVAQFGYGPITSNLSLRSARHVTEETHAHNYMNLLAEQQVHWREQSRNALNFQQASFDRTAQECWQAARYEVNVAVAPASELS